MHNNFYKYAPLCRTGWLDFHRYRVLLAKSRIRYGLSMTTAIGTRGVSVSLWLMEPDVRKRREEAMIVSRMTAVGMVLQLKSLYSTNAGLS